MFAELSRALPALQALAEGAFTSTCRVETLDGDPVIDEMTGQPAETLAVLADGVPCKVQDRRGSPLPLAGPAAQWTTLPLEVHLPVSAVTPPPGALITITASPSPGMVGRRFRALSIHRKDWQTAQRVPVEALGG